MKGSEHMASNSVGEPCNERGPAALSAPGAAAWVAAPETRAAVPSGDSMQRLSDTSGRCGALALCALLAAGCGASKSGDDSGGSSAPPVIESFTSAVAAVHVGESTQVTAVFSGDSATIDGIGPVGSGTPVTTPPLARPTAFVLTVRRGSRQVEASISIDATYRGRFRQLAPSPVAYTQHVAMALADGGALVMGGHSSESPNVPDTDASHRFDPVTEAVSTGPQLAFSAEADLTTPVELEHGGFLLVGPGINSALHLDGGLRATQVFDALTGTFHRVGDLGVRHDAGGTATALADGSVLVAGGEVPGITAAERYDPASERWTAAGDMATARRGHTATRLADGRVLIAGGVSCCDATGESLTGAAEIFDPVAGSFQPTGSLTTARARHAATLLADGRVLVTGGFVGVDGSTTASAEIYDPSTARFSPVGAMQVSRIGHSSVLLTDGRVLVAGGMQASTAIDIFEPAADLWRPGPTLEPAWGASTVTLLRNGRVLVFGGEDALGFPVPTVMVFE
ncbi:MAG TPA: kelch repeat-containing protein [Anaeromyxobacteraceae bacterium]|nr:kelch repeat-containing protein [Anaeromyxobacteraceae bacterium]